MRINFIWIIFLILPCVLMTSLPVQNPDNHHTNVETNPASLHQEQNAQNIPKPDESSNHDEQIISVRITSSVAVGRSKAKSSHIASDRNRDHVESEFNITTPAVEETQSIDSTTIPDIISTVTTTTLEDVDSKTELPTSLVGANIEFIKQLQAKKGIRGLNNYERLHSYDVVDDLSDSNQTNDSVAESSVQSVFRQDADLDDVPLARSVPLSYSSKNYIQDPPQQNSRLTTVNFNVVHDTPKINNYNDHISGYINPTQSVAESQEFYNQPSKVYSQPAQIYSEPAKIYSEPAKIYSEPAKVYSEPAKVYSEPSKIYSEPAKFYSKPASLHLNEGVQSGEAPWTQKSLTTGYSNVISTPPTNSLPYPVNTQRQLEHEPEKNYEVDEKVSVMTDGRTHGEQTANNPENCKQENCKVGYVVEGRQFRKYRVEERTPDGFIVGEYGVVRNEDGALRGVRYTADSDASPRLIHDALMKFLQLK